MSHPQARPVSGTGRPTPGALASVLRGQRRTIALATVLLGIWQICESLVPVAIGQVIDRAILPGSVSRLLIAVVGLAVLFLVLSLCFRFGSRTSLAASRRAAHELRVRLAAAQLDPAVVTGGDTTHSGEMVWSAAADADRVAQICSSVPRVAGAVVSLLVAAVVILTISIPLGILVLVAAPLLLMATHLLGRPLERRAGMEQAHAAQAGALAADLVTGLRVLKGVGGEPAAVRRYRAASRRSQHATIRAATTEAVYDGLTTLLTLLFLALVTLVAGRLAAEGRIEVGALVSAVGLAQFLIGPLSVMANAGAVLARARASATRLTDLLAPPRRTATGALPAALRGTLTLDDGVTRLEVGPGELVGVVAEPDRSAAVAAQLAGRDGARVLVDGVDLDAVAPAVARRTVLVAAHDAVLFDGSLADNLAVRPVDGADRGAPGVDPVDVEDTAIRAAIRAAALDQVAQTLPAGLHAGVGERGRMLSGGQRQRVALARALAAEAPVLVLHEPTTAVDSVTESHIAGALRELRAGRTTLVLTTSPQLLARCDRVLLLEEGAGVRAGTHETLADLASYRELVLG
ncbi:MAG: ABC transporter ATP-binding protein [Nocardioides sp.]|uniref:ABC transporter transmembrane domain-containing protein n=1 Tax=Nocardioides sp. TaxID=35761 RepID=UPI0039E64B16